MLRLGGAGITSTLQISPHVLTGCLHMWKNILSINNSEDNIKIAVTASSHRLSKEEYRAATDCLSNRWEKCVDSAGDYTE